MRATLEIDGTVMVAAEKAAADRAMSVDDLTSDLLRQALVGPGTVIIGRRADNGFPVAYSPADLPPITPELIRRIQDDDDEEYARRAWPQH